MPIAHPHRWFATVALVAAASGCAPKGQTVYVAPTDDNVSARLEAGYDGRSQHVVVENRSTVSITVTSVSLTDCENVKTRCEVHRMREAVPPGVTRRVMTVQAENPGRGHRFRYNWTWEGDKTAPPLPTP